MRYGWELRLDAGDTAVMSKKGAAASKKALGAALS
jgi:hypothetical protein